MLLGPVGAKGLRSGGAGILRRHPHELTYWLPPRHEHDSTTAEPSEALGQRSALRSRVIADTHDDLLNFFRTDHRTELPLVTGKHLAMHQGLALFLEPPQKAQQVGGIELTGFTPKQHPQRLGHFARLLQHPAYRTFRRVAQVDRDQHPFQGARGLSGEQLHGGADFRSSVARRELSSSHTSRDADVGPSVESKRQTDRDLRFAAEDVHKQAHFST